MVYGSIDKFVDVTSGFQRMLPPIYVWHNFFLFLKIIFQNKVYKPTKNDIFYVESVSVKRRLDNNWKVFYANVPFVYPLKTSETHTRRKICQNTDFLWPVYSRILSGL